ncbi:replication protein A 70 kDa DNA-binding subunit [Galendromus occidentalis]|uniref:Replication protein A 70 kDa DNA-binding subunit n=1 Tax=Galendromus occidentalis TaxID=34638 RepID=A0AAJ7P9B6_9ACAR|nr:replication protein A 70 kDa DNA-binding subunit [Galendromus occidentalis]
MGYDSTLLLLTTQELSDSNKYKSRVITSHVIDILQRKRVEWLRIKRKANRYRTTRSRFNHEKGADVEYIPHHDIKFISFISSISCHPSHTRTASTSRDEPQDKKKVKLLSEINVETVGGRIEGRVISKSPLREWKKADAEGKLFTFNLTDNSGEISCIVSGELAEVLFPTISIGSCYEISGFRPKPSHPQYSTTSHSCEIQLSKITRIKKIEGDFLPKKPQSLIKISEILDIENNKSVDLIAIVYDVMIPQMLACRDGQMREKQNVLLVDDSMRTVSLGLWGESIRTLDGKEGHVINIRAAAVKEYNGKKLLSTSSASILKHCESDLTREEQELADWWDREGHSSEFAALSINK